MRAQTLSLLSALAIVGCSSTPSSSPSNTRAVTGTLSAQSYGLDNPVVLAESSDQRVFVASLTADGHFQLNLPPNVAYRLTLANSTATPDVYAAVARINWPLETGPARWAVLGDGATLDLGTVYRRATGPDGRHISSYGDGGDGGSDGGSCKEDDGAKCSHDHDDDCDCDHKYSDDDHCEHDDHGEQHDHDCDHEHNYGGSDGGCTCGGGYGGGTGGEHEDDHGGGSYGHGACDGGAPTPPSNGCSCGAGGSGGAGGGAGGTGGTGGAGGTGGGANGSPCNVNADCASGACISSVCAPPSTQIP
jgi:hypothetical protein